MKRKLLFGERMLLGDGTAPFNAIIPFRLQGTFEADQVQYALDRVQQKHPWLKAIISHDQQQTPWFEVPGKPVPIPIHIVNRTSDSQWQDASLIEWNTPFDTGTQPLIRLVWLKGTTVSDMLLAFHHCLCDGGSAMSLLREFLVVLDDPSADIGIEMPIRGIRDVVPPDMLRSRRQRLKARLIGHAATIAIKCVPLRKKAIERQEDYLIHWKVDQELSREIMHYCKSNAITVNTFLCATILQAFINVRGAAAFNKLSCPVDIRRFAPQIKEDHLFAFGLMIVLSLDQKRSFQDNLHLLQTAVAQKTAKLNPYITMMVMESAHNALNNFTKFLKQGKSSNDCMFSNLGQIKIPSQYRSFTLETIFSPSVIGPLGNTTTLVTSTFRNEMDFSFVGSEGYLPYTAALAIRDEITRIIQVELNYLKVS